MNVPIASWRVPAARLVEAKSNAGSCRAFLIHRAPPGSAGFPGRDGVVLKRVIFSHRWVMGSRLFKSRSEGLNAQLCKGRKRKVPDLQGRGCLMLSLIPCGNQAVHAHMLQRPFATGRRLETPFFSPRLRHCWIPQDRGRSQAPDMSLEDERCGNKAKKVKTAETPGRTSCFTPCSFTFSAGQFLRDWSSFKTIGQAFTCWMRA